MVQEDRKEIRKICKKIGLKTKKNETLIKKKVSKIAKKKVIDDSKNVCKTVGNLF